MNNNLKTKGKTLIKLLLDRTLHKNTGLNLWISEVHLSFLIIKLSWKNISLFLLQKRSIRVCIIRTLVWSFKTLKKKQWNDTYFTRSKISYFLFASPANPPPPPPRRDRTASNNSPSRTPNGWTCPEGLTGVGW